MTLVALPIHVVENAETDLTYLVEEGRASPDTNETLNELEDALHLPHLKGYLLPQDALFDADIAIAVLAEIADAVREGRMTLGESGLAERLKIGMERANSYTTYRLGDTFEAIYRV